MHVIQENETDSLRPRPLISRQERLLALPRTSKRFILVSGDVVLLALAFIITLTLFDKRFDVAAVAALSLYIAIALASLFSFGLYRTVLRYQDQWETMLRVVASVSTSSFLLAMIDVLGIPVGNTSLVAVFAGLASIFLATSRLLAKRYLLFPRRAARHEPVIIYGAGEAGAHLAFLLKSTMATMVPIAFVDDNLDLMGTLVAGIPVYRPGEIARLIDEFAVTHILLAVPSAPLQDQQKIFSTIEHLGVRVRTIPTLSAILTGEAKIDRLEEVDVSHLIGRQPVKPNRELLAKCITGKVVLVTGAGGSIGSELCRQILALGPTKLVLFDMSEFALYSIREELLALKSTYGYCADVITILGSVNTFELVEQVLTTNRVETIYHAAAYKHVPLVEGNAVEGIRNNILGAFCIARAALRHNVRDFVLISSDKAVRPTNIMGATKRVAELIMQGFSAIGSTTFSMVRFGNVLESSGSVVPLFRKQIRAGGPVTVTQPDIIRYFMTIPEAAELVLQAGAMATGGDVFVLDMGEPVRIVDLAERMIRLSGYAVRDLERGIAGIEIRYTGLRPGEKLYEELLIGDNVSATSHPLIMRATEESLPLTHLKIALSAIEAACEAMDEKRAVMLLTELVPITPQQLMRIVPVSNVACIDTVTRRRAIAAT